MTVSMRKINAGRGYDYLLLFGLNPMAGVVEGFRWALFRAKAPSWGLMGVSLTVTVVLLVGGLYWFRRVEHRFADVI